MQRRQQQPKITVFPTQLLSGRSGRKFIEYALRGVCSDGTPYEDSIKNSKAGFLYVNKDEMLDILTQLVKNPDLRKRVRFQAHQDTRAR
jgi:hypothetical protein